MGVLNVTPDSFSDGGRFFEFDAARHRAEIMLSEGADIIDIGGESTAPGRDSVPTQEELARVLPIVTAVSGMGAVVSIDSSKPGVVRPCLEAGAGMINDVTGGENSEMARLALEFEVPLVLMHMQGRPRDMQAKPQYDDVVRDIGAFFRARLAQLDGVQVVLDPGIGFGKTVSHNLQILREFESFTEFGRPLLVGTSRKQFIGTLQGTEPLDRLEGTIASHTIAIMNGADIIRVHNVKAAKRAAQIADAVRNGGVDA